MNSITGFCNVFLTADGTPALTSGQTKHSHNGESHKNENKLDDELDCSSAFFKPRRDEKGTKIPPLKDYSSSVSFFHTVKTHTDTSRTCLTSSSLTG